MSGRETRITAYSALAVGLLFVPLMAAQAAHPLPPPMPATDLVAFLTAHRTELLVASSLRPEGGSRSPSFAGWFRRAAQQATAAARPRGLRQFGPPPPARAMVTCTRGRSRAAIRWAPRRRAVRSWKSHDSLLSEGGMARIRVRFPQRG
jgi:hypothetical protein